MLNEVLRQKPNLKKFKQEKEQVEKDYLNFKIASFKATELMINDKGIDITKKSITDVFDNNPNAIQIVRLSKDKDFIEFLEEKGIFL